MISWTDITRCVAAAGMLLGCAAAQAGPVTLNFEGSVSGYEYIDLSAGLSLGAPVSLSLTFNETFSDGTYSFADSLGPVIGSMSVGNAGYVFDDVQPWSYRFSSTSGDLISVQPMFQGTGPQIGSGALYGLFMQITPALTLVGDLWLGYGFTTHHPSGTSVTSYGYAQLAADHYSFTRPNAVPVPATLPLAVMGLLAALWAARRGARRART